MKKKDLAKIALAAFMLASTAPTAGNATTGEMEAQGTVLARGCGSSCGATSGSRASCSATPTNRASCSASSGSRASCSATPGGRASCSTTSGSSSYPTSRSSSSTNYPSSSSSSSYDTMEYTPGSSTNKANRSSNNYRSMSSDYNFNDDSSYQGTTTGPGPNGGYPGAPRGTYNTNSTNPQSNYYNR